MGFPEQLLLLLSDFLRLYCVREIKTHRYNQNISYYNQDIYLQCSAISNWNLKTKSMKFASVLREGSVPPLVVYTLCGVPA